MSPFRFEDPVEPADLIGRARETEQVLAYARVGRAMSIAAPRRGRRRRPRSCGSG